MVVETNAEHLVAFAFMPVGTGEELAPGIDHLVVIGDVGLDGQAHVAIDVGQTSEHLHAGLAAGVALLDRHVDLFWLIVRIILTVTERGRHPVDCGQEAKVCEPGSLERLARSEPALGADPDPEIVIRLEQRVDQRFTDVVAQRVDNAFAETVARQCGGRRVSLRGLGVVTQLGHRQPRLVLGAQTQSQPWARRRCCACR